MLSSPCGSSGASSIRRVGCASCISTSESGWGTSRGGEGGGGGVGVRTFVGGFVMVSAARKGRLVRVILNSAQILPFAYMSRSCWVRRISTRCSERAGSTNVKTIILCIQQEISRQSHSGKVASRNDVRPISVLVEGKTGEERCSWMRTTTYNSLAQRNLPLRRYRI